MKESNEEGKNWKCPECTDILVVKSNMGEGVKWCLACNISWFIICCKRYKKEKK